MPRPGTTGPWPGGDRPAVSSTFTPRGPRQALLLPFLRNSGWLQLCVCGAVCTLLRERRALEPHQHVQPKPYPLVRAFVLYCRSLWVCSRSAIVSAGARIAANKNMRAAAAQSEASFTPAHCSQNHVHCSISMNSWPLRRNPKGRNACMIALTSPNSQDFKSPGQNMALHRCSHPHAEKSEPC